MEQYMKEYKISRRQYIILSFFLARALFVGGGISYLVGICQERLVLTGILGTLLGYFILYLFYQKGVMPKYMEILISIGILLVTILSNTVLTSHYLLKNTPTIWILLLFMGLLIYGIVKGIKSIAMLSEMLIFFSLFIILLSDGGLIGTGDITNLLPYFTVSFFNIVKGMGVFMAFSLLPVLLLLPYNDNYSFKDVSIGYLGGCLVLIILFFFIISIYGSNFASIIRFPEYFILRKIHMENYISNIENILVLEWIVTIAIGSLVALFTILRNSNGIVVLIILIGLGIFIEEVLLKNYAYILYLKEYMGLGYLGMVIMGFLGAKKKTSL